jgi:hypothetical protein
MNEADSPLQEAAALDELELRRELSELCHKLGVPDWEALVKAIFDSLAKATEPERVARLKLLKRKIEEFKLQANRSRRSQNSHSQGGTPEIVERLHRVLKVFVDEMPVKK